MRIVLGSGHKRRSWEIGRDDYKQKRQDCKALLSHVGLPVPRNREVSSCFTTSR